MPCAKEHEIMTKSVHEARAYFPRGLVQPAKGFRFSVDALLLACFVRLKKNETVLDLGTGCGVVGLGLLLRYASLSLSIIGLDRDKDMIDSARANVRALGFEDRIKLFQGDVRDAVRFFRPQGADVVVCNPPYRTTGRGRECPDASRNEARFLTDTALDDFLAGAAHVLKNRGRIYLVFLAEGLDSLFAAMTSKGIVPKRVMPVYGRKAGQARLVLVEGRKHGGQGMVMEPPLFLYSSDKNTHCISQDALDFCPFLACNRGN